MTVLSLSDMVYPLTWHYYDVFASSHIVLNVWLRVENGTRMQSSYIECHLYKNVVHDVHLSGNS